MKFTTYGGNEYEVPQSADRKDQSSFGPDPDLSVNALGVAKVIAELGQLLNSRDAEVAFEFEENDKLRTQLSDNDIRIRRLEEILDRFESAKKRAEQDKQADA